MSSMLSSALNQNLRGIIDFPQKLHRLLWKGGHIFKLLSLAGVVLGGIGTLLSGWADNKEQEAIIEEKVNEALAARNEEEES